MPKFHVHSSFELTIDRPRFVIAGKIVEGAIQVGMFARIPFNSSLSMTVRIEDIGFMRRTGSDEDVCLCLASEPEAIDLLRALDIRDETLEITTEGSD